MPKKNKIESDDDICKCKIYQCSNKCETFCLCKDKCCWCKMKISIYSAMEFYDVDDKAVGDALEYVPCECSYCKSDE